MGREKAAGTLLCAERGGGYGGRSPSARQKLGPLGGTPSRTSICCWSLLARRAFPPAPCPSLSWPVLTFLTTSSSSVKTFPSTQLRLEIRTHDVGPSSKPAEAARSVLAQRRGQRVLTPHEIKSTPPSLSLSLSLSHTHTYTHIYTQYAPTKSSSDLQTQYGIYKNTLQQIAQKIGDVEQEAEEHK